MSRLLEETSISAGELENMLNGIIDTPHNDSEEAVELPEIIEEPIQEITETPEANEQVTETISIKEGKIPLCSNSLLLDESCTRFSSAIWYNIIKELRITVVGAGGIGSWLTLLLSRLQPSTISLWDSDTVEAVNLGGQLYGQHNIGEAKTKATIDNVIKLANYYKIYENRHDFDRGHHCYPITICGLDNMNSRRIVFEEWRHRHTDDSNALFIDARLAAEEFQVFCLKGDEEYLMNIYDNTWLFTDEEADETICSYKQTSFCSNMVASVMVNLLVNHAANMCNPLVPRELPFLTEYDASTMMFKTK